MSKSSKMKKHNKAMREAKTNKDKARNEARKKEIERLKKIRSEGLSGYRDIELMIKHGLI